MLLANEAAANYARIKEVPFVYRIHEEPNLEKTEKLKEILQKIGVSYPIVDSFKPAHLAQILITQGKPYVPCDKHHCFTLNGKGKICS